jgi:transketolase
VVLIASGSEVGLALEAARVVAREGVVRVVSMPSWELFARQTEAYRREVIPDGPAKLAIEAGSGLGWERFVGPRGRVLSLERFGASAPYPVMAERFGFTPANVVRIVREMVAAG